MHVASFSGESPEDIIADIRHSELKTPSLGLIFSSVSLDIPFLSRSLAEYSFPIVGCSSAGEILLTGEESPILELSAVCALMDPSPESFRVSLFQREARNSITLGKEIGRWGREQYQDPIFILFISGLSNDGEQVIKGIEQSFPSPPPVYGGVAGDDGRFEETYVFLNETYSSDGVVVILLDGSRYHTYNLITSGWRGVGAEKVISRSEGNIVYSIEGRPALDLYTEYLNLTEDDIPRLSIDFPLIVRRADGTEVTRVPLGADKEKRALIFAGSVPEGSIVRFSSSPGIETIRSSINDITQQLDKIESADLLLVFSCMARYQATGELAGHEILAAGSGKNPLIGFFSYGEIGNNSKGRCEFYNETFTLLALTEKKLL